MSATRRTSTLGSRERPGERAAATLPGVPPLPALADLSLAEGDASPSPSRRVLASAAWAGGAIGAAAAAVLASDAPWLRALAVAAVAVCSVFAARRSRPLVALAPAGDRDLEGALALADVGYWRWDLRHRSLSYSPTCASMLGHDPVQLGASISAWGKLVHPEDLARARAALDAWISGESPAYDVQVRIRTADGAWRWIRDRGHLLERDDAGKPIHVTGLHIDVDDHHHAPAASDAGWLLVVDDDPDIRLVIETAARRLGYRAISVDRAMTALAVVAALPDVRLIVSDHDMPEMTGIELVTALRQRGSDIPLLLTSGRPSDEIAVGKASAFLPKPFSLEEFRLAVTRLVPPRLDDGRMPPHERVTHDDRHDAAQRR